MTSTPSNNLKDEIAGIIEQSSPAERDWGIVAATQILNLILDTILASEEMQDDPAVDLPQTAENVEAFRAEVTRNYVKRQMRTMMEGLKQ